MKKKKKKNFNCSDYIKNMADQINKNKNNVWLPSSNLKFKNKKINTWFNIFESNKNKNKNKNIDLLNDKFEKVQYNSIKVNIIFNKEQKKIVNKWMESFRKMYNETLFYIKNNRKKTGFSYNWIKIRNNIKNKKDIIASNCSIKVHELDFAIKLACSNYKTCLTNYKNNNIKHFRIRYWGYNKENRLIKLEKRSFNNGTIRGKILGKIDAEYNSKKYNLSNVKADSFLQYNGREKRYYLYVPKKINLIKNNEKRNEFISCDPGIRTFITGISENRAMKICNKNKKIKDYLKRKDKIQGNDKIPKKIKNKNERQINKKLENYKNELHWKTINYMTKNYKFILIGNMSTKRIINKDNNLDKMSKRIVTTYNLYEFRERLKYKCYVSSTKYKIVDERFTSKMCSNCGNVHKNLGGNKKYECVNCKIEIDRDINGARCILLKSMQ